MFENYRNLSRDARYLVYSSIFPSLAFGMFFTDLSYFLTTVQGISYDIMGLVITLMGVSTFATSIPFGVIADKYGRKKLLVLGNIMASVIIAVFALTTNTVILLIAAVVEGTAEGAFSASINALLAEKAGDEGRTGLFSLYGFAGGIAFGVGSFIIPIVVVFELIGFTAVESHILLYVMLAALSLASTVIMLKVTESGALKKTASTLRELLPRKSRNVIAKYVLTGAIIAFGAGMIVPLMSAWLKAQYGISDAISGPILGLANIVIGVATLASPILARRIGLINAIVLTQAISTVFMFATPLSPNFAIASFVYTLRAFLMNMANPLQQSMIMGLVAEDERGAASGISGALWRLPNALSSYIGAFLIGIRLLAAPFFLAGFFYIASILLFWMFFKRIRMPEETSAHESSVSIS